ncbi:MAG: hypothetical protein DRN96_00755 [Thermoproteota archaeon]|nr:MAG: hypothetical protein DRN96_00755 [Candidatus Korarchaeota archaeon]RLG54524.1 MAG: hypothetical protein DRN99_04915 [Candidatus Korarchaeota archaeon]
MLKVIREGRARILGPDLEQLARTGKPYTKAEVFYNPRMVLNRDFTVLFTSTAFSKGFRILDLLAGTGVRGIRVTLESNVSVSGVLNDRNKLAYRVMLKNIVMNKVADRLRVENCDANILAQVIAQWGDFFDYVDIDPFGSPAPFLDGGIRAVGKEGVVGCTATDTAVLYGRHSWKAFRTYGVHVKALPCGHEVGLRLLIGYMARQAAKLGYGLEVLASYFEYNYFRVFAKLVRGARKAEDTVIKHVKVLYFCEECLDFSGSKDACSHKREMIGPMWAGSLGTESICRNMLDKLEYTELASRKPLKRILSRLLNDIEISCVGYYDLDEISSRLHLPSARVEDVVEKLRELGYRAGRTHFTPKGVKTDAPASELVRIFSS